ncbi:membrane protein [Gemmobacter lanyuensis]|uniref:Membrane protein n=1 Tax=Gemmobacter lanyuensis TaxID=1054497 RepID=A0A918IWF5_9RHOB|nr:DUF1345 domain-containing protein [Gemmobacter lanyuensis]GGW35978.1 membrane protein [Gemmobacter lanyuensis]
MFARHRRFLIAFAAGLGVGAGAMTLDLGRGAAVLIAANAFFVIYLALMVHLLQGAGPAVFRRHGNLSDEGVPLIAGLALSAVALSLWAIAHALSQGSRIEAVLAIASVPLGWSMLHVLAAAHYAALWYQPDRVRPGGPPARGLAFPGGGEPGAGDFLYFSFTIGMTAQVSDVVVERPGLRRLVLAHGVVSFFYNTVILALAVNAAVG